MRMETQARFLEYAAWAHANPKFDFEERDHRLEVAQRMRGLLEATREGSVVLPRGIETVFRGQFAGRPYSLTVASQNDWLKAWAVTDEESLARALVAFLDAAADASERFARFSRIVDEAEANGKVNAEAACVLAFGSLFNFGLEPESLPVIRPRLFNRLEQILGTEEVSAKATLQERYEHHVEFARRLQGELAQGGVPIRDMVDVQSLIWLAGSDHEAWAAGELGGRTPRAADEDPPPKHARRNREQPYLSVCAIYRDEAPYLQEWIEFHRLVGVERFFLYDNGSKDAHRDVLDPYLADGTVTVHDWPVFPAGQPPAYDHCLSEYRESSRWIAFIDIDEFLFSPTYRSVPEMLAELEEAPGIGVNLALFGSSGHFTKPQGLVLENYLQANLEPNAFIKSIVDPERTIRCEGAHHFAYETGSAADENGYPIAGFETRSVSHARLRINHYWAKSEEEFRAKYAVPQPADGSFRPWPNLRAFRTQFCETDRTILKYLPTLRENLA